MTNVSGLEINEVHVAVGFVPVCGVGYEVEMIYVVRSLVDCSAVLADSHFVAHDVLV